MKKIISASIATLLVTALISPAFAQVQPTAPVATPAGQQPIQTAAPVEEPVLDSEPADHPSQAVEKKASKKEKKKHARKHGKKKRGHKKKRKFDGLGDSR